MDRNNVTIDDESYEQIASHSDATRDIAVALHKTAKSEQAKATLEQLRDSSAGESCGGVAPS